MEVPMSMIGGPNYQYQYEDPNLCHQMGQMSLQDPAFIEELRRIEQNKTNSAYFPGQPIIPNQGQGVFTLPVPGGATAPGSIPPVQGFQGLLHNPGSTVPKPRSREEVCELTAEEVRWFYKPELDKLWIPFDGYDSLRIEIRYRHIWQTKWRQGNK
ncbi:phospholipase DDHD1, partial [Eurytemora carolleeae]|uniref:phospholipase DDHD1 n=1 Tax=Eurytemora carolleeae TaxID=1294199 RepID=UPI000C78A470